MRIIRKILDYLKTWEGMVYQHTITFGDKQYRMYARYGHRVFIRPNEFIVSIGHSYLCPRLEKKFGVKFQRIYMYGRDYYILQV